MKSFFKYFALFLAFVSIVSIIAMEGFASIISIIITILMAGVIATLLRFIFLSLRSTDIRRLWLKAFIILHAIFGFFITFLITFVVYQNHISPLALSHITLQNNAWQKVIFAKMVHIASPQFYQKTNEELQNLDKQNFVFLAEGVGSWSQESQEKIKKLLWGFDASQENYDKIAKVMWFEGQTHNIYNGIDDSKIRYIDLSLDQLSEILDSKKIEAPELPEGSFDMSTLEKEMSQMNFIQKAIIKEVFMSVISAFENIGMIEQAQIMGASTEQVEFLKVILHDRNAPVVKYIIDHPTENIAIVYGAAHFDGIFEELKKHDASWKITDVKAFHPFRQ